MFVDEYKEFKLGNKVKVSGDVVYGLMFGFGGISTANYTPVINYITNHTNKLTIIDIDYNPALIIQASFSFAECGGSLLYGQFIKYFPKLILLEAKDF